MADAAPAIEKPIPVVTPDSKEFFEGAQRGQLVLQRCGECGLFRFVARRYCPECGSPRSTWQQVSGRATLVSFVRVHQKSHPAFVPEIPYPVAWVELEEGPRLLTGLVDVAGVTLKAGLPLRVRFVPAGPDLMIPKFAPA